MTAGDIIVVSENGSGRKGNYLDGTDDYVLHDAHAVARVAANDQVGTYTAWIYLDNITSTNTILSAGDNSSTDELFELKVVSAELKVFLKQSAGTTQFDVKETTGSMVAKTWTHVAVVQNGTRPVLYVNGEAVAMTDTTSTDLTFWYDELSLTDKFAIGVRESNNTHTNDYTGAIGQVKYFNIALSAAEVKIEFQGRDHIATGTDAARAATIETARVFDITMENDGVTDSGSGADDGTLTGGAIYGGEISDWSYKINENVTGHAAEFINTVIDGSKFRTIIKRGD